MEYLGLRNGRTRCQSPQRCWGVDNVHGYGQTQHQTGVLNVKSTTSNEITALMKNQNLLVIHFIQTIMTIFINLLDMTFNSTCT